MTAALAASQTGASTSELIRVVDKVNADIEKLNQLEQQAKNQEITEQEYNEVAVATLNQYNTDVETLAKSHQSWLIKWLVKCSRPKLPKNGCRKWAQKR